jgi:hypothetical protein
MRYVLRRAWGRVRCRIAAIIVFTGTSTILVVCLAVAALNVVVRRESANVVEKQIQVLVQASRSVAPAILDHAGACTAPLKNSVGLKPLLAYTDEAFPQAQASLVVESPRGVQSVLPGSNRVIGKPPDWLPDTGFAGLVVDRGQQILNQELTGHFGDYRYATLFWAAYNVDTSVLTYVNAGNPLPILIRPGGEIERLDSDGFPIGMFANARYMAKDLQMQPGSRLVVFSDGLTDAQNAEEEEFGDERLTALCRTIAPGIEAEEVAERLMQAVAEWSAGAEQFDDTTVVVVDVAA